MTQEVINLISFGLDSDNEITFLGIPVTDELIQDVITNHSLELDQDQMMEKVFTGYFDNSSSTYILCYFW